jgi:hypothetical protein
MRRSGGGWVHAIKFEGILRTVESGTMATGLPVGLDKRFVLSMNGIRLPWGRYSLPDSTCTFVRRIRIPILIVMRYRIGRHSGLPSALFSWDSWQGYITYVSLREVPNNPTGLYNNRSTRGQAFATRHNYTRSQGPSPCTAPETSTFSPKPPNGKLSPPRTEAPVLAPPGDHSCTICVRKIHEQIYPSRGSSQKATTHHPQQ